MGHLLGLVLGARRLRVPSGKVGRDVLYRGVLNFPREPDIRDFEYSSEYGAGGGLRKALPLLGDTPVFTMNTDSVWSGPNPLAQLAAAWDPAQMDALLLCIPREDAIGHAGPGDFVIETDGRASRGPGVVYTGLQILKTDGLTEIPEPSFSLNILWNRMLREGRLHAVTYPGKWCDVGTPEGITLAEAMLHNAHV